MLTNPPTRLIQRTTYFVLVLSIFFYCLDYYFRIVPGLIIPELLQQYHTTPLGIGSYYSGFYLGYLIFQIPSGLILDRYPLRPVLVSTILLCTIAFIASLYANSIAMGWLLRFLTGATSAFSFIAVLYIAKKFLPARYFNRISGITIGAGTVTAAFAQVISAYFMQHFYWRHIIIFLALWGFIVSVLLMLLSVKEHPMQIKVSRRVHWAELWQQIKALFKNRFLLINGVVGGLYYLPTSIFAAAWGVTFLTTSYHLTRPAASIGIFLIFAGWAVGSPLMGLWGDRSAHLERIIARCATATALVSALMLYASHYLHSEIFILLFLFGLLSSAQVLVWKIFSLRCPAAISGIGIAFTNMIIMLGGTIFHTVVGWLLNQNNPSLTNLTVGLTVIPLVFICAAILSKWLRAQL